MRAPQIPENLVADETKFQVVFFVCLGSYKIDFDNTIAGVPSVHGLSVPVFQPASVNEQLRRAFRLRLLLDRGTLQAWRSPGRRLS